MRVRGSMTIPSPSTQVTPLRSTPEGMRWVTCFLPSTTMVWPALAPPPQRATTWAFSVRRSTTFPLPSSPHCAPTTTTTGMTPLSFLRLSLGGLGDPLGGAATQPHHLGKLPAPRVGVERRALEDAVIDRGAAPLGAQLVAQAHGLAGRARDEDAPHPLLVVDRDR